MRTHEALLDELSSGGGASSTQFAESAADAAAIYEARTFARLRVIRARVDAGWLFRARTNITVG